MTSSKIAECIHGATRVLGRPNGDIILAWNDLPDIDRNLAIKAVDELMINPQSKTYEELHDLWWELKIQDGWVFGEFHSHELKTHPCMIPYQDLPKSELIKDEIWSANALEKLKPLFYTIWTTNSYQDFPGQGLQIMNVWRSGEY